MTAKKRRLIYVDASCKDITKETKISLFDPEINKLDTLNLEMSMSSSQAELYAILYACLYVKKNGLCHSRIHILNDNMSAVNNLKIQELCKDLNISISWIPREANLIADKGTKLEVNIKKEESNLLLFFYELIIGKNLDNNIKQEVKLLPKNIEVNKETTILKKETDVKEIITTILIQLSTEDKPYVSMADIGKMIKSKYTHIKYKSLKKLIAQYPKDFNIVNSNFVKSI